MINGANSDQIISTLGLNYPSLVSPTHLPIPIIQTGLVYVDEQIVYMLTATIYI